MLVHLINEEDAQIFKSHDYVQNKRKILQYLKYAETWQSASVIHSHAPFLCDILLIVTFITFFLKYCKTMQAMLAYLHLRLTLLVECFPPLFTINHPEEDQIIEDLEDIEEMQTMIQGISFVVCVIVAILILYQVFK